MHKQLTNLAAVLNITQLVERARRVHERSRLGRRHHERLPEQQRPFFAPPT
jgi:hypothetical protein